MLAEFIQLPKEGETIGPYLLREVLSSSILGTFYQATHKLKHENVLIHILPEALLRADSRFQQRYKETIERQKKLPLGAAMGAVELHRISGNLVVQYPQGNYKCLNKVILSRKEPMSEERVQQLLNAIGKGLMDALKLEQGHYFMTPDFLFLNEDGEIRIGGVGLFQSIQYECFERFVSGAVVPVSLDKDKSFTALEILSPEIRNFKARDLRSDFYCIGMCAYFMLTGEKPVRRWATPTKARRELAEGWDLFISRCLEPKPVDRFPNYKAFISDLNNVHDLTKTSHQLVDGRMRRKLNRIPLPQAIENLFSMRHLLFVRLFLLGLAGVLTVGTASMLYQIIFSDFGETVSDKPIRRVSLVEQANLTIHALPKSATVSVIGPVSGRFTPLGYPLMLKGKSGKYTVQVRAPKYRAVTQEIELDASEPMDLRISLLPDFANIGINGAVGTEMYVMPESGFLLHIGTIEDEKGLVVNNRLLSGKHRLVGLHKSYLPATTERTAFGRKRVEITLTQPPKPTELVVTSAPEGAKVTLDGALLGLTPLRVQDLSVGFSLDLRVEKEGYRPVSRTIQFEQGEEIEIDTGVLEQKIGTLSFRIDLSMPDPPDMRELMLSVNGDPIATRESGSMELPEGGHMVKLEHPDYYPFDERIVVVDRKETAIKIVLKPRPVRMKPVIGIDVPTRFLVDGIETPLTEKGILPLAANRAVEVEVIIRDHLSVIQSFQGKPNERREWEVPLKPIPGPVEGEDWSPPYFNLDMVWLSPASFEMGSPVSEFRRLPNEDTATKVTFTNGYWIGTKEVRQSLYEIIMRENPSQFKGDNLPVESVNWEDANEFCQRLTIFEQDAGRLPAGWVYRLPTEAEWEYAARGGTLTPFSFGREASPEYGNFHGIYREGVTSGDSTEQRYGTMPVGSFDSNGFGLFDVHGNVAEWTLNKFWDRHTGGEVVNPANLKTGRGYTIKGGSWKDTADRVRSAAREGAPGTSVRNSIGFRVVLAPLPTHTRD